MAASPWKSKKKWRSTAKRFFAPMVVVTKNVNQGKNTSVKGSLTAFWRMFFCIGATMSKGMRFDFLKPTVGRFRFNEPSWSRNRECRHARISLTDEYPDFCSAELSLILKETIVDYDLFSAIINKKALIFSFKTKCSKRRQCVVSLTFYLRNTLFCFKGSKTEKICCFMRFVGVLSC